MGALDDIRHEGNRDGKLEILQELLQLIESKADLPELKEWAIETVAPLQAEIDEKIRKQKESAERIRYVYRHGKNGIFNYKKCVFKGTWDECQNFKAKFSENNTYYSIEDQAPWDGKVQSKNDEEQE